MRSARVVVLVVAALMATGCFKITSKGPRLNVGPGVVRSDWNQARRDPDPTAPLMPSTENPWAAEAPREPDTEETPRWARKDVEDWLARVTAAALVSAATGDPMLFELWMVW